MRNGRRSAFRALAASHCVLLPAQKAGGFNQALLNRDDTLHVLRLVGHTDVVVCAWRDTGERYRVAVVMGDDERTAELAKLGSGTGRSLARHIGVELRLGSIGYRVERDV